MSNVVGIGTALAKSFAGDNSRFLVQFDADVASAIDKARKDGAALGGIVALLQAQLHMETHRMLFGEP